MHAMDIYIRSYLLSADFMNDVTCVCLGVCTCVNSMHIPGVVAHGGTARGRLFYPGPLCTQSVPTNSKGAPAGIFYIIKTKVF